MPFIGNKPSAVPLTSADIADGIITSAKIVDGTIANADINSSAAISLSKLSTTGTADATTFLRGDGAYTAVSSDYVLLATTNITSSTASVSFDGYYSSTYKNYKVIIANLSPVSSTSVRFRFRRSNADVTATNYMGHVMEAYWREAASSGVGSSGQVWAGTNDYGWISPNTLSGTNAQAAHSEITIFDPLSTAYKKHISHFTVFYTDSGYVTNLFGNYFLNDNNNAHSGITFYATSGNIVNGNFKLYGIK
jgi:hypothetical protein